MRTFFVATLVASLFCFLPLGVEAQSVTKIAAGPNVVAANDTTTMLCALDPDTSSHPVPLQITANLSDGLGWLGSCGLQHTMLDSANLLILLDSDTLHFADVGDLLTDTTYVMLDDSILLSSLSNLEIRIIFGGDVRCGQRVSLAVLYGNLVVHSFVGETTVSPASLWADSVEIQPWQDINYQGRVYYRSIFSARVDLTRLGCPDDFRIEVGGDSLGLTIPSVVDIDSDGIFRTHSAALTADTSLASITLKFRFCGQWISVPAYLSYEVKADTFSRVVRHRDTIDFDFTVESNGTTTQLIAARVEFLESAPWAGFCRVPKLSQQGVESVTLITKSDTVDAIYPWNVGSWTGYSYLTAEYGQTNVRIRIVVNDSLLCGQYLLTRLDFGGKADYSELRVEAQSTNPPKLDSFNLGPWHWDTLSGFWVRPVGGMMIDIADVGCPTSERSEITGQDVEIPSGVWLQMIDTALLAEIPQSGHIFASDTSTYKPYMNLMYCDTTFSIPLFADTTTTGAEPVIDPLGQVTVYPNPATSFVQVKAGGRMVSKLELYNLQGKLLKLVEGDRLSVAEFPAGVYLLGITTGDLRLMKRIVKR